MFMNKYKQRIVFMGTPDFAASILEALIDEGYNIVAVVSQPDKPVGRKKIMTPSPVRQLALAKGIPVLTPQKIRHDYADILAYDPQLIITAAYGQIVPKEVLDYPEYKCINTHASLLPEYRGGAPIQRAIINGEEESGMSIMYMNEKMDEGDILYQQKLPIDIHDTGTSYFDKMAKLGKEMLLEILPLIFEGQVEPVKQNNAEATYAPNLDKDIEHIYFNEDVKKVYDHIRGLLDNPGAYFVLKGRKYKLERVFFTYSDDVEPNTFAGLEADYLRLDCNNGYIRLYQLKPEGKNSMTAAAFYNGAGRGLAGEHFE